MIIPSRSSPSQRRQREKGRSHTYSVPTVLRSQLNRYRIIGVAFLAKHLLNLHRMLSIHRNADGSYRLLSSDCVSVQRELPHSRYECEEQDNLYVRSSQAALRHYVLQRGSEIGSMISPQAYNLLEERLLYGGSNKLSLVYADFDILDWHYTVIGAPDDYYPGAIQTLRDDFGLDYCDLICFFCWGGPFYFRAPRSR